MTARRSPDEQLITAAGCRFGGGDEVFENLLVNTCRESSDHGPINSWDRVPYITDLRTGQPSIIPAPRRVHHNFILATYNSQVCVRTI